jgi:hypothetical protein
MTKIMYKKNWFETLNSALESEGLVDFWPLGVNLSYGESYRFTTECGKHISIFRETDGRYERPIHYQTRKVPKT